MESNRLKLPARTSTTWMRERARKRELTDIAAGPRPVRRPEPASMAALRHDRLVHDHIAAAALSEVPRIPASAGSLIFDEAGRLLILKPNYKRGWTVPGGQINPDGESPWEGCQRETLEESGLQVEHGRLVCVDFLRPKANRPGGVRFLFDCGTFSQEQLAAIRLQADEIDEYRLAPVAEAKALLSGPLRRRISASVNTKHCVYLEDGRPVPGVQR